MCRVRGLEAQGPPRLPPPPRLRLGGGVDHGRGRAAAAVRGDGVDGAALADDQRGEVVEILGLLSCGRRGEPRLDGGGVVADDVAEIIL